LTTTDTTEAPTEASVEVEDQAPAPAPAPEPAPASRPSKPITQTTGRRKRAVARVRLRPGNGKITVNRRSFEDYFTSATHRMIVSEPLRISNIAERYDIDVTMDGGGTSGQAGALRLGITRALVEIDPELRTSLKRAGLLTRDAREKESKKYGLKKARKAPQYSKR
jgi:small subunit ribosomal protein S9